MNAVGALAIATQLLGGGIIFASSLREFLLGTRLLATAKFFVAFLERFQVL